jgi:serine/threonine protein kinase
MSGKPVPAELQTLGNYNLVEQIGSGSMGTVYKAQHWETHQVVAIKIMSSRIARNPVLLRRFEQEFRIASKLDHPNIVRVLEYCVVGETPFLVMEFVEGETVGDMLERMKRLTEEEAVRIVVQVSHGLHRAHRQGLIHRDIKPDNIMVPPDGKAKILDLGLAKQIDAGEELTRTGAGLGTPNFMSPEQFRNAKNASVRCDIYSLAASLYMMVTGELPFGRGDPVQILMRKLKNELPSPRQLVPELTDRTDWTIKRALSADPEKRPASCREFAEDLIGHSTRNALPAPVEEAEEWFLVFRDASGSILTATGSTRGLRRSILEGHLGNPQGVRASRHKSGPFELLHCFPEFRDLVVGPAPAEPPSDGSMAHLERMLAGSSGSAPDRDPPGLSSDDEGNPYALGSEGSSPKSQQTPPPRQVPSLAINPPTTWVPVKSEAPDLPATALEPPDAGDKQLEHWRTAVLIILTAVATLLASRYLLPFLQ